MKSNWEIVEKLYREYQNDMFREAKKFLKDETAAEDVVQLTVMKLWRQADRLRSESEAGKRAYVLKAVRNQCRDLVREKRRQERLWKKAPRQVNEASNPERMILEREELRKVLREIQNLNYSDGHLLHFCAMGAFTYDELSQQMEISKKTLAVKIHRARKRLRIRLREDGEEGEKPG